MYKRYVPIDRVRPLVLYLERVYGGLRQVSEVTDIPYRTLQGIRLEGKNDSVAKPTAGKLVEATLVLRRRRAHPLDGTHEVHETRRYANADERKLAKKRAG